MPGSPQGRPLKASVKIGFAYADCRVDDSRLVVLNALDAASRGAQIRCRTSGTGLRSDDGAWQSTVRAKGSNRDETVSARTVVNAAGRWVGKAVDGVISKNIRLVRGSHITVPTLYEGDHA